MKNILVLCLLALPFVACKKDADTTSDAEYYFVGKIDGQPVNLQISPSSDAEMIIDNDGSLDPPSCTYSYGCAIGTNLGEPGEKSVTVRFPNLFEGDCGDQLSVFPGLFPAGSYPFGFTRGKVMVEYFDGAQMWTINGYSQTAATFEVTASEMIQSPLGASVKLTGRLSCTLYNEVGDTKKVENAAFALSFWPG